MGITRNTVASSRRRNTKKRIKNIPTENRFIRIQNNRPYINMYEAQKLLLPIPSPLIKVEGDNTIRSMRRFINDQSYGLNWYMNRLDLSRNVSEEKMEKYILDAASIYIYNEPGKFSSSNDSDKAPENFEHPDDMPPIDKGLSELNITKEDFKI